MKLNLVTGAYVVIVLVALLVVKSLATSWLDSQEETKMPVVASHAASPAPGITAAAAPGSIGLSSDSNQSAGSKTTDSSSWQSSPAPSGQSASMATPVNSSARYAPGTPETVRVVNTGSDQGSLSTAPLPSSRTASSSISTSASQSPVGTASSGSPVAATEAPAAANVSIPAAFGNPSAAGITTPEQSQQVAQIANGFTAAVQASGAAPNTPAYQQVWNAATLQANQLFKQQYGWQAFEVMQRSANAQ